jgi:hypothetical protein
MKLSKEKQILQTNNKIQFHSYWKNLIFKFVKDCSYVGFEQYKNTFFIKIRNKDKKEIVFELAGTPDDMTSESYKKLLKEITNDKL